MKSIIKLKLIFALGIFCFSLSSPAVKRKKKKIYHGGHGVKTRSYTEEEKEIKGYFLALPRRKP